LFDALQSIKACAQKVGKKLQIHLPSVNLINDDFGIVFVCYQYQEEGLWCSTIIPFFLFKHEEKKPHNMLCLMLDPRF
jgi:hypothetical protein